MGQTCTNCKAVLSCGCQRVTASDGTLCCNNCIQSYEQKLTATKVNTPNG
jgi:hypothetical protein